MNNIILIGMPGSGKSTVSNLCKKAVIDTDAYIESRYGSISEIFANYGEARFRDIETEAIKEICKKANCLIATGGGAVLREENVMCFKQCGKIVYLRTRLKTLLKRIDGDKSRPLLRGAMKEQLTDLYNARTPVYESVADIIVDTDGLLPEEIFDKIMERV